ncbi:MAG: GWxTD domain-containing protein [Acidobacteria bacterium]|nr:GWxTD domain-containing protein [Acidobacteriota bacterium]MCA1617304.1 GWxTD domain-containing protein [Acidobacteriota bacterium]
MRFKDEIARRIAAADSQFKLRRQRGAESARGRILIVLGGPSRVSTSRPGDPGGVTGDAGLNTRPDAGAGFGSQSPGAVTQTWIYAKDKFDPSWGVGDLSARVNVDASRGTDELQNPDVVNRAIAVVVEKSIVNPAGAASPSSGAGGAAPAAPPAAGAAPAPPAAGAVRPSVPPAATGAPAPAAAPPAPAAAALPAATRSLLDGIAKEKKDSGSFWGGPFRSIPGDPFYALELSVPADKAPAATAKFAGLVTNDAGQDVATFWDDATLTDVKTGIRTEKIYERSVVLPPGSYRGTFALVTSDGATPLASGTESFQLHAKTGEFEVSPLILASTLTPLTKRPAPTDPFVFGMEKPIRVDPKGNRLFARDESLWYFYTVTNPKAAAGVAAPAPAAPGAGAPAPAADAPKPRIMARIGVLREGQPAFAPFSGPAELQPLGADYYGTGSEIPLASFEPGYYTFSLNVRDLNAARDSAAFKGVDRKEEFVVLKPDGSMPDRKAAAGKPAPKAPAKKPS